MSEQFEKSPAVVEASLSTRISHMKKYNISLGNFRTSITLEPILWQIFEDTAKNNNLSVHQLASFINDRKNADLSLSAAIRLFLTSYYYGKHISFTANR